VKPIQSATKQEMNTEMNLQQIGRSKRTVIICLTAMFMLIAGYSSAAVNTLLNSGTWETPANWSTGSIPTDADDVIIPGDIVVTINSSAICGSLTFGDMGAASSITISGSNSLTIATSGGRNGNLYFNPNNNTELYQLNVNAGSLTVEGQVVSGGNNGGGIVVTTGSVLFSSTATMIWGEAVNVTINGTGNVTFNGDLSLSTVSSGFTSFSLTNSGSFIFNGAVTQSDASYTISNTGTAGNFYFNDGYDISAGTFTTMNGTNIYASTAFNNSGSSLVLDPGSNFIVNANTSITPTSAINLGDVIMNSGNTLTLNGNISVAGDWTNNGGTLTPNTSTVTFNSATAKSINGTAASQTFYNVEVALGAGQALSIGGSTTTFTTNSLTLTTGNFSAGTATTVNIDGDLTITTGTYTCGTTTNLTGSLSNAGTFTGAVGRTLNFIGATNATVTGAGTFLIYNIGLNKSTKATTVEIQSSTFITGINTAAAYNFTFTRGTWRNNHAGSLTDCHNNGTATTLTIPFAVCIENIAGTMTLCRTGTMVGNRSNISLSGKLLISGGVVNVATGTTNVDFQYLVSGGTPELEINGGTLNLGAGFNYNTTTPTDYVAFTMTNGTINSGSAVSSRRIFAINNVVGSSVNMTGGRIVIEESSSGGNTDVDLGGSNVSPYSVTGGVIQFGNAGTGVATTYYFTANGSHNYPHMEVFATGLGKTLRPYNTGNFEFLSVTIPSGMALEMRDATGADTKTLTILSDNAGIAFSCTGTFNRRTSTVQFSGSTSQNIHSTGATITFHHMTINKTGGSLTGSGSLVTLSIQDFTHTAGTFTPGTITSFTVNGNTVLTAGTFSSPTNTYIRGNWTNNGATFDGNNNTLNFTGGNIQTIGGTVATENFYNLTIAKTSGIGVTTTGSLATINCNNYTNTSGNFTPSANFNVAGNVTLTAGTFTAGTAMSVGGNFTHATGGGVVFTPGTGTVTFNGSGTQNINGTRGSQTFYHVVVNKTAGTVLRASGSVAGLTFQDFTMTTGDFNANTATTVTIAGNFTHTTGTFTAGATTNLRGNWTVGSASTFTPGTNTVNFTNGNTQEINGTASSLTLYNTVINKTAGTTLSTAGSINTLTTNNLTNTQGIFTAPATLNINGNYTLTAGAFNAGAQVNVAGNWSHATGATFTPGTGTVTFTGAGTQSVQGTAVSETFYNVIINKADGSLFRSAGSVVTITTQNFTQTQGDVTAPATFNVNGDFTLDDGTYTASTNLHLYGDWIHSASGTAIFTPGANTVNFRGGNNQLIRGAVSSETFYHVTINKTANTVTTGGSVNSLTTQNVTLTAGNFTAPPTINVNGNVVITDGTLTAGTTMNVNGLWTHSAAGTAIFNHSNGTVNFTGAGTQTIGGAATSETFYNLNINKSAGTANSGGTVTTVTVNNLQILSGTFTPPATLNIDGNFSQSAGTFNGGTNTNVLGNWTRTGGTFTPGTGTVTFASTSAQQTIGGSTSTTFYSLNLNNTYGTSPQFTATNALNVNNTLTFSNGVIDMGGYTMQLGSSTAARGTLAGTPSASTYVSGGSFKRWYNAATLADLNVAGLFPIGDMSGNGYSPIYFSASVAPTTGGSVTARYNYSSSNTNVAFLDGGTPVQVRTDANWVTSSADGLAGGTYRLNAAREFCAICVGSVNDLRLVLSGSVVGTAGTNSGITTFPYVQRTGISLANLTNTFYVGSVSSSSSPLPVELGDFKATVNGTSVVLDWFTYTESNNDYYTIEKSANGTDYEFFTTVDGSGNSSTLTNYTTTDPQPFSGRSVYRLSQTDFNGDKKVLKSVSVNMNKTVSSEPVIYPNPNNGTVINIDYVNENVDKLIIELTNINGQLIYYQEVAVSKNGLNTVTVNPLTKLPTGKYLVTLFDGKEKYSEQVIVH
jgi:hypothetical protein